MYGVYFAQTPHPSKTFLGKMAEILPRRPRSWPSCPGRAQTRWAAIIFTLYKILGKFSCARTCCWVHILWVWVYGSAQKAFLQHTLKHVSCMLDSHQYCTVQFLPFCCFLFCRGNNLILFYVEPNTFCLQYRRNVDVLDITLQACSVEAK